MLDFVVLAMVLVSVVLLVSIYLVRSKSLYQTHKTIQTLLAVVLLATIVAFEIDIQFVKPYWRDVAKASPFFESGWVDRSLWIHLMFAVPTPFFWAYLIVGSYRNMGATFENHSYRNRHRKLGWIGTILMLLTAITGWIFYWVSFVAS